MKYTEKEIEFLKNNYPEKGALYCAEKLKRSHSSISDKACKMKLKVSSKRKSMAMRENGNKQPIKNDNDYNVNPTQFYKILKKEIAYILGLLWADGYVLQKQNGTNTIIIECLKDDIMIFKKTFFKIGKWNLYFRIRKNRNKIMGSLHTNNKPLVNFLISNDYRAKSYKSPDKILKIIPKYLHKYFFRGLIDGDGCFYINKKNYVRQFSLASGLKQDWKFMINLCKFLKIKTFSIQRRNRKLKDSTFRITNKDGIIKIGNYIYDGLQKDKMGLKRKFKKFQEILFS